MFAITDIETTGGNAQYGGITEVAIAIFNGQEVVEWYHTLINPQQTIPRHITALTGISDHTVADAPLFEEVAPRILEMLNNRIFVAHNVNFDYSFLHYHLQQAGYPWQAKKLCTVRYARRVIPGLPSYSLGNLCREVGIEIVDRHRATGDVTATVQLMQYLTARDTAQQHLQFLLRGRNPESYLPMHVPLEQVEQLPYSPGVYYFHDKAGKIIYVGKARNLRYRVKSHFTNNAANQRKQEFIRNIHCITHQPCATEMMAFILEEIEIKRLWPEYNRSQKRAVPVFGLYAIRDQRGFTRLVLERKRKNLPALCTFHRPEEGYSLGRKLVRLFGVEESLVFATADAGHIDLAVKESHNRQMEHALAWLQGQLPDFLVTEVGEDPQGNPQKVGYLLLRGNFVGMGLLPDTLPENVDAIRELLTAYPDNDYIKSILFRFADENPERVTWFPSGPTHQADGVAES